MRTKKKARVWAPFLSPLLVSMPYYVDIYPPPLMLPCVPEM